MRNLKILSVLFLILLFSSCSKKVVLAFGSCSDQNNPQLWQEVINEKPQHFFWLGDAIYAKKENDTNLQERLLSIKTAYKTQKENKVYQILNKNTIIDGIWDDHDYGMNDGGIENPLRNQVKELFLNFLDVPSDDPRHHITGIYYSKILAKDLKVIFLDTRSYRTKLKPSTAINKRYDTINFGSMLGDAQWSWFENELKINSFKNVIIVSSIQLLNESHHFEKWGLMPQEKLRFMSLLEKYNNKKYIILSGDRHFSEVSYDKGIFEITSSSIAHSYSLNTEPNPLRISPFIKENNFGVLTFKNNRFKHFKFVGKDNQIFWEKKVF
jgi:alkaline phosphatase D